MSVSTSNIGRRADGSFEQYVPPGVVAVGSDGQGFTTATPGAVQVLPNGPIPRGFWMTAQAAGNAIDFNIPGGPITLPPGVLFWSDGVTALALSGSNNDLRRVTLS